LQKSTITVGDILEAPVVYTHTIAANVAAPAVALVIEKDAPLRLLVSGSMTKQEDAALWDYVRETPRARHLFEAYLTAKGDEEDSWDRDALLRAEQHHERMIESRAFDDELEAQKAAFWGPTPVPHAPEARSPAELDFETGARLLQDAGWKLEAAASNFCRLVSRNGHAIVTHGESAIEDAVARGLAWEAQLAATAEQAKKKPQSRGRSRRRRRPSKTANPPRRHHHGRSCEHRRGADRRLQGDPGRSRRQRQPQPPLPRHAREARGRRSGLFPAAA
jgi:hypothetical protein